MRTYSHRLAGDECVIHFPEHDDDLPAFREFITRAAAQGPVALDTETTGLAIYSREFGCRLVQFGTDREAWVVRVDRFARAIRWALAKVDHFIIHNAAFDVQVLDVAGLAPMDTLLERTYDTKIMAHLRDPRQPQEGGIGLGLKQLSSFFVDATAPDTQTGLNDVFRREYKATKVTGWALIDIDHPLYVTYAGLDVLLASRLFRVLDEVIRDRGLTTLCQWEHEVQAVCCRMMKRGVLLDVDYTSALSDRLGAEAEEHARRAALFGVDNVNSTVQLANALLGMGETLTEKTPSGAWKVDKEVLAGLADLDKDWERAGYREPNGLADAVMRSKRAGKWRESYALAMLNGRDFNDRVHPDISSLAARTARMSISRPPLQQLPSGDWTIRRCLVADPGQVIVACDYKQVEMRVLAALADEQTMKAAIKSGQDLHDATAEIIYGAGFSKSQRKLAKTVGFGKVYGGGAVTLARQSGAPLEDVKEAVAMYDRSFPGVKRLGRSLVDKANWGAREVVTPVGRRLPLDGDRLYAATNYLVQSTARDLLCQALIDMEEAGLGKYLLLPVHDEVIAQAPPDEAEEVVRAIGEVMTTEFYDVPIESDPEVYGPSWGHGYGAPNDELEIAA